MSPGMRPPSDYRGPYARFQRARGDPMPQREKSGRQTARKPHAPAETGQSGTNRPGKEAPSE